MSAAEEPMSGTESAILDLLRSIETHGANGTADAVLADYGNEIVAFVHAANGFDVSDSAALAAFIQRLTLLMRVVSIATTQKLILSFDTLLTMNGVQ